MISALSVSDMAANAMQNGVQTGQDIPVLSAAKVSERLQKLHHDNTENYKAFYSSVVGGITTDPAAMVVPIDDHMVHRGHAVFDTALLCNGHLYELEPHMDRFERSATKARLRAPYSREELRRIIIATAAESGVRDGHVRYWMSAGIGGFTLSMSECPQSSFYAIALAHPSGPPAPVEGIKVITSSVPIKPREFATTKSVNYLPNAMVVAEAEENGASTGIWLDQEGYVGEGPSMNVAFVTADGYLLVPDFERILAGCTMKKVMVLAEKLMKGGSSEKLLASSNGGTASAEPLLKGVRYRKVTVEEGRSAAEMMLCGSGVKVKPVVQWDDSVIGSGKPGPVTLALKKLLAEEMESSAESRIPVPYR